MKHSEEKRRAWWLSCGAGALALLGGAAAAGAAFALGATEDAGTRVQVTW